MYSYSTWQGEGFFNFLSCGKNSAFITIYRIYPKRFSITAPLWSFYYTGLQMNFQLKETILFQHVSKEIRNITGIEYQSDQWLQFISISRVYDTLFCEVCSCEVALQYNIQIDNWFIFWEMMYDLNNWISKLGLMGSFQKSHNMTFKDEYVKSGLFDLVTPYSIMDWKTYGMLTKKEKALSGGQLLNPGTRFFRHTTPWSFLSHLSMINDWQLVREI